MEPNPQDHKQSEPDWSDAQPMSSAQAEQVLRIPLIQEGLEVGKRVVDTGRGLRIHKSVQERAEQVDMPLRYDELTVEHVPMGHIVADAALPVARYEGETLILPVVEEVLELVKQWRLKEEIHITRHQRERHMSRTIMLRSETVHIERFEEPSGTTGPSSPIVTDRHTEES